MIKAEFTVYGTTFAEIDLAARVISRKFLASPRAQLSYECEHLLTMNRWKAEVTATWETDEP